MRYDELPNTTTCQQTSMLDIWSVWLSHEEPRGTRRFREHGGETGRKYTPTRWAGKQVQESGNGRPDSQSKSPKLKLSQSKVTEELAINHLLPITPVLLRSNKEPLLTLTIQGKQVQALLDSGAHVSVLPYSVILHALHLSLIHI